MKLKKAAKSIFTVWKEFCKEKKVYEGVELGFGFTVGAGAVIGLASIATEILVKTCRFLAKAILKLTKKK